MRAVIPPVLLAVTSLLIAQQQPTVIKTTTRQVVVNVVIHDKKGQPVSDLTKDDFAVFDKGQQQEIRYFAVEKSNNDAKNAAQEVPLAPGYFSNRVLDSVQHRSLTAILLDGVNTETRDQTVFKKGIAAFLQNLQPGDRVAIYALTREHNLQLLHDFSSDTAALLRAWERFKLTLLWQPDLSSYEDPRPLMPR